MFDRLKKSLISLTRLVVRPYGKLINKLLFDDPVHKSFYEQTDGGFTHSDWENIGNDLRKSIVAYGEAKLEQ